MRLCPPGFIRGLVCVISALCVIQAAAARNDAPLVVICEQAEARIAILEAERPWTDPEALLWEWRARDAESLEERERDWFNYPTDAKPVLGSEYLLITASGGGVALVRIADRQLLFHAYSGGNPHTAELLPDRAVVSASSSGNFLKLWQLDRNRDPVQTLKLRDAHGLYWDQDNFRLWALGGDELMALSYAGKNSATPLKVVERIQLPQPGGHDLGPADSGYLVLSTYGTAWRFDPRNRTFLAYPGLESVAKLKSISEPATSNGDLPALFVQATEKWWSDTVRSTDPAWSRTLPGGRIYKARWLHNSLHNSRPPASDGQAKSINPQ